MHRAANFHVIFANTPPSSLSSSFDYFHHKYMTDNNNNHRTILQSYSILFFFIFPPLFSSVYYLFCISFRITYFYSFVFFEKKNRIEEKKKKRLSIYPAAAMFNTGPSFPPSSLVPLVEEVSALLCRRQETLSVAETAAGGIISAALLSSPGASRFYKGGVTIYSLASRVQFAGWTDEDIKTYAGPSTGVVTKLAENVRVKLDTTYTICESGTAGPPAGFTRNRIPGYVALAVATPEGTFARELDTGSRNRAENMVNFAAEALRLLKDVIKGDWDVRPLPNADQVVNWNL